MANEPAAGAIELPEPVPRSCGGGWGDESGGVSAVGSCRRSRVTSPLARELTDNERRVSPLPLAGGRRSGCDG
jgi:hypothetical protein